ncbi:hypothetical protein Tco_1006334 [Tanacetum coccineum]|uniref:Uncharacterized protein n=1 Tax=Tanacetum coccineum TaxID=301880 RepID=A0ABQ5FHL1_9ASTR
MLKKVIGLLKASQKFVTQGDPAVIQGVSTDDPLSTSSPSIYFFPICNNWLILRIKGFEIGSVEGWMVGNFRDLFRECRFHENSARECESDFERCSRMADEVMRRSAWLELCFLGSDLTIVGEIEVEACSALDDSRCSEGVQVRRAWEEQIAILCLPDTLFVGELLFLGCAFFEEELFLLEDYAGCSIFSVFLVYDLSEGRWRYGLSIPVL